MLELLDIVDSNDVVIGQLDREEVYRRKLGFRAINGFVVNDLQQVWIPRRSANKTLFPSCLDASVGGHVSAGETYEEAFVRELAEELNLSAERVRYACFKKLTPADGVSAYMHVYISIPTILHFLIQTIFLKLGGFLYISCLIL